MTGPLPEPPRFVVMYSGGIGSWGAARRIADQHGTEGLVLLFTDVKGDNPDPHVGEDEDTYRFIADSAADIGGTLVTIADGRDIWRVFEDRRFLGSSRQANCSTELKQKPARKWVEQNCGPDTVIVVGIDWTEEHRLGAVKRGYAPLQVAAPLCDPPYVTKADMLDAARARGLEPPRLYAAGFSHNNCGGGCVRAGQAQFALLLETMPDRFAVWEAGEARLQAHLGRPVTILQEQVAGVSRPLPLSVLRERHEAAPAMIDRFDVGGCGCFVDGEDAP